jgi:hypothetical protein
MGRNTHSVNSIIQLKTKKNARYPGGTLFGAGITVGPAAHGGKGA